MIFDFRFKHYITPHIIRATWAFVVFITGLLLTIQLIDPIVKLQASQTKSQPPVIDSSKRIPEPIIKFETPEIPQDAVFTGLMFTKNALWVFLRIILAALGLLWTRVLLEFVIVVFNISHALNQIETNTTRNR